MGAMGAGTACRAGRAQRAPCRCAHPGPLTALRTHRNEGRRPVLAALPFRVRCSVPMSHQVTLPWEGAHIQTYGLVQLGRHLSGGPSLSSTPRTGISLVSPHCHHPQGAGITLVSPHCHLSQGQASLQHPLIAIILGDRHRSGAPSLSPPPGGRNHFCVPSLPSSLGTDITPVPPHCHLPQGQASLRRPLTAIILKDRHHSGAPSLSPPSGTSITPVSPHCHPSEGQKSLQRPLSATTPAFRHGTTQNPFIFFPHIKLFTQQLFQSFAIAKPHGVPNHRDHKTKNPPPPPTPKGLLNADFQQRRKPPNNPLPRRSRQPPPTSRAPGSAHSRSSVLTYIFVPR